MVYSDPPWVFKGRALYQLHLVKTDEAKKYIPDHFKIVSLFGYTLGGFYLARYSDSPVGRFDELVALAGLMWNPPTSCAWAARVYVNNGCFCRPCHDIDTHDGGTQPWAQALWIAFKAGVFCRHHKLRSEGQAKISQLVAPEGLSMVLPPAVGRAWAGPRIRMQLPSYSGATAECPQLLQYTCHLCTNVRAVPAALVEASYSEDSKEALHGILGGRPVLTLAFDDMEMRVNKPAVVPLTRDRREEEPAMRPALAWAMAN